MTSDLPVKAEAQLCGLLLHHLQVIQDIVKAASQSAVIKVPGTELGCHLQDKVIDDEAEKQWAERVPLLYPLR